MATSYQNIGAWQVLDVGAWQDSSASGGTEYEVSITDSFTLSDAIASTGSEHNKTITESITISDTLSPSGSTYNVDITESFTVSDFVNFSGIEYEVSLTESFVLSDVLSSAGSEHNVDITESFDLSDTISSAGSEINAIIIDALTLSDLINWGGAEVEAVLTESFTLSDTLDNIRESYGLITESFTVSDSVLEFDYSAFLSDTATKCILRYYFTLTGNADGTTDIEIPISSFTARRRSGDPTFLSVVIPSIDDYAAYILARPNGDLVIDMAYVLDGVEQLREEIVRVDFEDLVTDKGSSNQSTTLSGHKTETFSAANVALSGVTYRALQADGMLRFRCSPIDIYLKPGDTATYGSDSITIDLVSYFISADESRMEITGG